jgi:L-rhamnose mutarotase
VVPDRIEEYKARHEQVWPEMLQALRETGWHNYSLFLTDDGQLIGYVECDDFVQSQRLMEGRDVNAAWQKQMAEFFLDLGESLPDQSMQPIPEVFHLD